MCIGLRATEKKAIAKKMETESDRKRTRTERVVLASHVETLHLTMNHAPASVACKSFKFGTRDGFLQVVTDIQCNLSLDPPNLYFAFCSCLQIDPSIPATMVRDLCKGCLPDNVVVTKGSDDDERIVWFACTAQSEVVVVDVTHWTIFPGVKFNHFPCTKHVTIGRVMQITDALHNLNASIEAIGSQVPEVDLLTIQNNMKALYDKCSSI